jgi:7,8-dihydropterin-6-yl-methyl-4-(beta-D-ribofuranosyl)aminobenzene 5'-phosphate synthase
MYLRFPGSCLLVLLAVLPAQRSFAAPQTATADAAQKAQVTILYDAFGKPSAMQKDWGFAALVEYGGKRILFDTGDNPDILANNAKVKGVDLSHLDFVVISHRHGDHIGGMEYLLKVNPNVKIYAPKENFGVFGFSLPSAFYRKDETLPAEQRYYDGAPPQVMKFGSAWPRANIELIDKTTEIAPGMYLISLVSDKPTTLELHELSLAIDTPEGMVLVVGCSHPGIDKITEAASLIDKHIHLIVGGLHMVIAKDPDIERIVTVLHQDYHVDFVAPGHCTGEPMFAALGSMIALNPKPDEGAAAPTEAANSAAEWTEYRALLSGSDDRPDAVLAYNGN